MTNLDQPLSSVRFVVVDVESTGGTKGEHRLTEIAMVVIEDGVEVARHESLVNPHEPIPPFIQRMTGITDAMVECAPEEEEAVAAVIREVLHERAVFVAHNVGFDWGFVKNAIVRQGGLDPDVTQLCTCKLSRRLHPDLSKHNLAAVAEHCNVVIEGRHRAMGDTQATVEVLLQLIERAQEDHDAATLGDLVALQYAPRSVSKKDTAKRTELDPYIRELPDEPGVYYFLSSKRNVLYIGKAKSLAKRVRTYFYDAPLHGRRVSRMLRYIKQIKWETTGTELGALLLESREIKTKRPSYNVASREYTAPYFLRFTNEAFPRIELVDRVDDDEAEYFGPFRSRLVAEQIRAMIMHAYQIRSCEGGLQPHAEARPCFDYHIKKCQAPCALLQTEEDYRASVRAARDELADPTVGAASFLQQRMDELSSNEQFESAAMVRDGLREIERMMMHRGETPMSVRTMDLVVLVPTSDRYATVELYALRAGRLVTQRIVGLKAKRSGLVQTLTEIYDAPAPTGSFSDHELDELRIITSWLHQRREQSHVFVVDTEHLDRQLRDALAAVGARGQQAPSEYSQIPEDHGTAH